MDERIVHDAEIDSRSYSYRDTGRTEENSGFGALPPHDNKMVKSVLATLFCCLIGGVVAIIYSAKSNKLYNMAMYSGDPALRQQLYLESVRKNATASTWLMASVIAGLIAIIAGGIGNTAGLINGLPVHLGDFI